MSLGGPAVTVLIALMACISLIGPVSAVGSLSLLRSYRKAPARRYFNTAEIRARRQFELPHFQVLHALGIDFASPQLHELVSQVAVDLLPFRHGITLAMVEQASSACCRAPVKYEFVIKRQETPVTCRPIAQDACQGCEFKSSTSRSMWYAILFVYTSVHMALKASPLSVLAGAWVSHTP